MESQKKALTYALTGIAILALAMVAFYYFQDRYAASTANNGEEVGEEIVKEEKSEFVGTYSPTDGPLEAEGKRIAFFMVNAKVDGGYLGSAQVDTIGTEEKAYFECTDVKIEESAFFLSCQNAGLGNISYNGTWERAGGTIQTAGKVLWMSQGNAILEQARRLQLTP